MEQEQKKTVFSGIQPTNMPTLGNYLGAMRHWPLMQDDFNTYYCVVDMHAITVRQNAAELRKRSVEMMALFMACGLDPEKSTLFIQSHVPEHAMLTWALSCNTYMGELSRMTQFKDKSAKHADNINAGLFTYPVLMAADILLYQTHLVPVGSDQKQHVELTRDIAIRFNSLYGDTFVIPEPQIAKVGARIMSLQEPDKKMSKSDPNPNGAISILDSKEDIARKFKRAVTDCDGVITADPQRAGVFNLLSIYSACAAKTMEEAVKEFEHDNYGVLKGAVTDAVIQTLSPVQEKYRQLLKEKSILNAAIASGGEKASAAARKTVRKVYHKMGFDSLKA